MVESGNEDTEKEREREKKRGEITTDGEIHARGNREQSSLVSVKLKRKQES